MVKLHTKVQKKARKFDIKIYKKKLAIIRNFIYNHTCCDIDSVEARGCYLKIVGVPWSECQVRKLATSHCTNGYFLRMAELRKNYRVISL